jgi:hypothetical protein
VAAAAAARVVARREARENNSTDVARDADQNASVAMTAFVESSLSADKDARSGGTVQALRLMVEEAKAELASARREMELMVEEGKNAVSASGRKTPSARDE